MTDIDEKEITDSTNIDVPFRGHGEKYRLNSNSKGSCALHFTHSLFFFYGFLDVMPMSFFGNASEYWMYKFRNVSQETVDANDRTTLQSYFQSSSVVAQALPGIIFMILSVFYGHLYHPTQRIIFCLLVLIGVFVTFTSFVEICTDTWQTGFFVMTMVLLTVTRGTLALCQLSTVIVVTRFPQIFMRSFLFGQSGGSTFCAALQILSLAVTKSVTTSAFLYFGTGTLILSATLVKTLVFKKTDIYESFMKDDSDQRESQSLSFTEIKALSKKIWPCLIMMLLLITDFSALHPAVTALVVSEYYDDKSAWSNIYFTPVITFLFGEICGIVGRIFSRNILSNSNAPWIVGMHAISSVIFFVLIIFCNAKPRSHLGVLFSHDYQYIIIFGVFQCINGFAVNVVYLGIGTLSGGKQESAMKILMLMISICGAILSPLGILVVSIL